MFNFNITMNKKNKKISILTFNRSFTDQISFERHLLEKIDRKHTKISISFMYWEDIECKRYEKTFYFYNLRTAISFELRLRKLCAHYENRYFLTSQEDRERRLLTSQENKLPKIVEPRKQPEIGLFGSIVLGLACLAGNELLKAPGTIYSLSQWE